MLNDFYLQNSHHPVHALMNLSYLENRTIYTYYELGEQAS